ncbi:MAG TPA: hypothetical protein VNB06_07670 [Thermoanaerobaculia bacterium]|nr:hypothetical protein [Thermoanaerobaculia bacterium]
MTRSRFRSSTVCVLAFVALAAIATPPAVSAQGERHRLAILDDVECAGVSGRYVVLLEPGRGGVVLSGARFPGARVAGRSADGTFAGTVAGFENVRLGLEATSPDGEVWALQDRSIAEARGCLAFDKDRFTWESDLLTYVHYLVDLLVEAQRLDPARSALWVGDRTVRLEVSRPGVDRATLVGPEGAMLGYGLASAPERFVFVPVPLGVRGETVLLRVLRSEGEAFGGKPMQHLGWALVHADEDATTPTQPAFVVRLVSVEEPG